MHLLNLLSTLRNPLPVPVQTILIPVDPMYQKLKNLLRFLHSDIQPQCHSNRHLFSSHLRTISLCLLLILWHNQ